MTAHNLWRNSRSLVALLCAFACAPAGGLGSDASPGEGPISGDTDVPSVPADTAPDASETPPKLSFTAVQPRTYVNKVKVLLTGLPATAEEVVQGADDAGLQKLVAGYLATSHYQQTALDFFGLAFQQSNVNPIEFARLTINGYMSDIDAEEFKTSFARTALDHANKGLPFDQLMSTNTFMMTTKMLWNLALMDNAYNNDSDGKGGDYLVQRNPNLVIATVDPLSGAKTLQEAMTFGSPNYLRFYHPAIKTVVAGRDCGMGSNAAVSIIPYKAVVATTAGLVLNLAIGADSTFYRGSDTCHVPPNPNRIASAPDHNWRLVTIRQPRAGEFAHSILDIDKFSTLSEVRFRVPRVSFFTTPAFLSQWPNNKNNQSRVLINQTLAVAIGEVFDGSNQTTPPDLSALSAEHATPNTACYGCHLTMDPMRQYFRNALTTLQNPQSDPNMLAMRGAFGHDGQVASGGNLVQLGQSLAKSPAFALGWTRKVCAWLNSSPCLADDPEILRLSSEFVRSNYNFHALVAAVATSPLTTYKTSTKTATSRGSVVSMAREKQLCRNYSARFNRPDACNDHGTYHPYLAEAAQKFIKKLPEDAYARGTTDFVQPTEPSIAQRIGLENACLTIAEGLVDNAVQKSQLNSGDTRAIENLLATAMGLSVTEHPDVYAVLKRHYDDVFALTKNATVSLRSTFAVACLSPAMSMIGI